MSNLRLSYLQKVGGCLYRPSPPHPKKWGGGGGYIPPSPRDLRQCRPLTFRGRAASAPSFRTAEFGYRLCTHNSEWIISKNRKYLGRRLRFKKVYIFVQQDFWFKADMIRDINVLINYFPHRLYTQNSETNIWITNDSLEKRLLYPFERKFIQIYFLYSRTNCQIRFFTNIFIWMITNT